MTEDFALVIQGKCSATEIQDALPKLLAALRAQLALLPEMDGIECRLHVRGEAIQVKQVGR